MLPGNTIVTTDTSLKVIKANAYKQGYNKAIDEFAEKLKETLNTYIEDAKDEGDYTYIKPFEISKRAVKEVSEQLKDGGENEY